MKRALIHVCLFVTMVVGLFLWFFTAGRSVGISAILFLLKQEGRVQSQTVFLLIILCCAIVPLFLSALVVEVYSLIATNKDTRAYRRNERSKKQINNKNIVHIIDNIFGVIVAISSLVVTAIVPFSAAGSPIGIGIAVVSIYFAAFAIQMIIYKIAKKQIENINRVIRNRKAWK